MICTIRELDMTGNSSAVAANGNPILAAIRGWQLARAHMVANQMGLFTIDRGSADGKGMQEKIN
jgi:hypothetical protein